VRQKRTPVINPGREGVDSSLPSSGNTQKSLEMSLQRKRGHRGLEGRLGCPKNCEDSSLQLPRKVLRKEQGGRGLSAVDRSRYGKPCPRYTRIKSGVFDRNPSQRHQLVAKSKPKKRTRCLQAPRGEEREKKKKYDEEARAVGNSGGAPIRKLLRGIAIFRKPSKLIPVNPKNR